MLIGVALLAVGIADARPRFLCHDGKADCARVRGITSWAAISRRARARDGTIGRRARPQTASRPCIGRARRRGLDTAHRDPSRAAIVRIGACIRLDSIDGAAATATRSRLAHRDHLRGNRRRKGGSACSGTCSSASCTTAPRAIVRRHGAFLLVDEAHAVGVLGARGRGSVEHFGLDGDAVDLRIGTLSKAIPAIGGFVAAQRDVVRLLRYTSSGSVFSAALTPADAAAATAALEVMESEPWRVTKLRDNAARFRHHLRSRGLEIMGSETPIVPVLIGDAWATLTASSALLARGVYVSPIIAPGVSAGTERLRCVVNADHSTADLDYAAEVIAEVVRPLRTARNLPRRRRRNPERPENDLRRARCPSGGGGRPRARSTGA